MQVITAKDAKLRFGELLDTMQREPVLVTKNNRPVGVFVSLNDVKGTYLEHLFDQNPQDVFESWEDEKIQEALDSVEAQPNSVTPAEVVHARAMQKAQEILAKRK